MRSEKTHHLIFKTYLGQSQDNTLLLLVIPFSTGSYGDQGQISVECQMSSQSSWSSERFAQSVLVKIKAFCFLIRCHPVSKISPFLLIHTWELRLMFHISPNWSLISQRGLTKYLSTRCELQRIQACLTLVPQSTCCRAQPGEHATLELTDLPRMPKFLVCRGSTHLPRMATAAGWARWVAGAKWARQGPVWVPQSEDPTWGSWLCLSTMEFQARASFGV